MKCLIYNYYSLLERLPVPYIGKYKQNNSWILIDVTIIYEVLVAFFSRRRMKYSLLMISQSTSLAILITLAKEQLNDVITSQGMNNESHYIAI